MRLLLVLLLGCTSGDEPSKEAVDLDGDGYGEVDCDDSSAAIHPGADETCDGVDNDCDGVADDSPVDGGTWYADADGDGFGAHAVTACEQPSATADAAGDCDDADAATHPGAEEPCDEPTDRNCDGSVGYADADGDGWAACQECDDGDAAVHPDAVEVCDDANVDEDCSGAADDADAGADAATKTTWYVDADADGHGGGVGTPLCDAPAGSVASGDDCDDAAPAVFPGAVEVCDPADVDEDCDGAADDADEAATGGSTWYADADGDGFGDAADTLARCDVPAGYVADATDCDDADAATHPGGVEVCDADDADEDCDGAADDADDAPSGEATFHADADGDGYGDPALTLAACDAPAGYVSDAEDCDDGASDVNPVAAEVCDAADVDEDCDAAADDADTGASGRGAWYTDADGDGYGAGSASEWCDPPAGMSATAGDCDDSDGAVSPAAAEVCNGRDDDCDAAVDDADTSIADVATWYRDVDADGYGGATSRVACTQPSGYVAAGGDCNDLDAAVSPGEAEICDAADADEDCDGAADDADDGVTSTTTWYADTDGDGYGDADAAVTACTAPAGYVADATDCNDAASAVRPGATEACNAVDDDCDGAVDDGVTRYYPDYDGDGYGDAADPGSCTAASGAVTNADDCDELSAAVNPGATEVCGGADEDCDGLVDDDDASVSGTTFYLDLDGDDFGDDTTARVGCTMDADETDVAGDCDDNDPDTNPDATELYGNDADEDCDGETYPTTTTCTGYDVPGDYATIAAAITALDSVGGTICLGARTYSGSVSYTGDGALLSFVGVSPEETTISGSFTFYTDENSSGVSLKNLTITGGVSSSTDSSLTTHVSTYVTNVVTPSVSVSFADALYAYVSINRSQIGSLYLTPRCGSCGTSASKGSLYVTNNYITGGMTLYRMQSNYSYVYGNTIDAGSYGFYWDTSSSGSGDLYLYNNIIYGASTAAIYMDDMTVVHHGYNLLYDNTSNYAGVATSPGTNITADPLLDTSFTPPVPRSGSPAIGAASSSYASTDYWGRSRSTRTIGAVEPY